MDSHIPYMELAIELGNQGRLTAPPNPWVGCVLVKEGKIVGKGFHAKAGQPHAEIIALQEAGELAKGSIAYTTLEPCSHFGRTGPCCDALIKAGITQVIAPFADPDPRVSGKGFERLKNAGIKVTVGVCENRALASLEPYIFQRKTGYAYSVIKSASSIDGRIAAHNGSSQWITGSLARRDVHRLRAQCQAILIGAQTAIKDNPRLTIRDLSEKFHQPLRVVLNSSGSLEPKGHLFDQTEGKTLIYTSDKCDKKRIEKWQSKGVEVEVAPLDDEEKIDGKWVLKSLGQRGILQVLIEGGSKLHSYFFKKGLWNQFILYQGACFLGPNGLPLIIEPSPNDISDALRFELASFTQFGHDMKFVYKNPGNYVAYN